MLRSKRIAAGLFLGLLVVFGIAAQTSTESLSERYLERANDAYDEGDLLDAYKNINMAMKVGGDIVPANVIVLARSVYLNRLKLLQKNYDEQSLIEIKTNLEQFPQVSSAEITKLVRQIEARQAADEKASAKQDQQNFMNRISETTEATQQAITQQGKQMQEQTQQMVDQITKQNELQKERDQKTDKKFTTIMILVTVIVVVIMLVVGLILLIMHISVKQSKIQQQQYADAFKLLAQNQSQTNQLMLGGITDIYGKDGLKSAGSSRWGVDALPEPEETPEEKEELRELAAKCEDLGAKIDQVTGRKNNSKNVSELVYKLAMRLGLKQHDSMVFFCAAMVYDAGFLSVYRDHPELISEEKLSDEQHAVLDSHIKLGEEHLQFVPKRYWSVFEAASTMHHENMDGSGKNHVKGDKIPEIARIIRVADSFIALSSKRSYRGGTDKDSAVEKLEEQLNIYDADVIAALKDII
ncbi:MAG: hypothetical protein K2H09_08620 [Treponemataceae bacterium]|nr:hypothetical protein [Treponemataceae bacterium]